MISTLVPSLIRTYVPVVVGALAAWLVTIGTEIDKDAEHGLAVFLTGLFIALYYTAIRLLEKKWPGLSVLLGSTQMPAQYTQDGAAVVTTVPAPLPAHYVQYSEPPSQRSQGSGEPGPGNHPNPPF